MGMIFLPYFFMSNLKTGKIQYCLHSSNIVFPDIVRLMFDFIHDFCISIVMIRNAEIGEYE